MREELGVAVELAIANSQPPPMNEIETCNRVIYPLLLAAGYGHLEIRQQDLDAAKQKPDYTILPDSPDHTWFLEAKAWNVTLDDTHAVQAINYANTQGKRWAVLSNGREWRLYDNLTAGTADVKLACIAHLHDSSFPSFLEALSKPSILQGRLEGFVRNQRLYTCLTGQISKADSDVVKAITRALRAAPGLDTVKAPDVVGFFRDYVQPRAVTGGAPSAPTSPRSVQAAVSPAIEPPASGGYPLGTISPEAIKRTRPHSLTFPDGTSVSVPRWNQLPVQVALYVLREGAMPEPPFHVSDRARSPLVARSDSPGRETMREPIALPSPYTDWLVEGHFSANDHQRASVRLLQAGGIDPSTLRLVLKR